MEAQPLGKGAEGRGGEGGPHSPTPQPPMPRAESRNLPLRTWLLLQNEHGEPSALFSPSFYPVSLIPPPPITTPHQGLGRHPLQTGLPGQSQLMPLSPNPRPSLDSYPIPGSCRLGAPRP